MEKEKQNNKILAVIMVLIKLKMEFKTLKTEVVVVETMYLLYIMQFLNYKLPNVKVVCW